MRMAFRLTAIFCIAFTKFSLAQHDSIPVHPPGTDTVLRIININPYFTLHVDSTLSYKLEINKETSHYYWFLRNSPLGLKIGKDDGLLTFKAEKSFFLSGKLKYDV